MAERKEGYVVAKRRPIDFDVTSTGCFVCTSHSDDGKGYRRFRRNKLMHRHIFEECFWPIPDGLVLRHKCDNRACINPEHLETGTRGDNAADMRERGRAHKPVGIKNPKAKLSEWQALELYRRAAAGEKSAALAAEYAISEPQAHKIAGGNSWAHITKGETSS